jgi:hypothetical protein
MRGTEGTTSILMPTLRIPIDRCLRIQAKLQEILLSYADPDLTLLLDDINTACSTGSVVTETNRPQRNKRTAPDFVHETERQGALKKLKSNRNADTHNTRNDGRKRNTRNTVEDVSDLAIRANADDNQSPANALGGMADKFRGLGQDRGVCNSIPPSTETSDRLPTQAPFPSGANCYGWDEDSDLSSLPSDYEWDEDSDLSSLPSDSEEEETSMGDTANHQKPRRRMAKTKQTKLQSWETVDDVRVISEGASKLLQLIAGIGDQSNTTRLLALKDMLSGQTQGPDSPETISLPLLVKRCEQSELLVAESKFKHMVNLMQLSLWLDQCVYSQYG